MSLWDHCNRSQRLMVSYTHFLHVWNYPDCHKDISLLETMNLQHVKPDSIIRLVPEILHSGAGKLPLITATGNFSLDADGRQIESYFANFTAINFINTLVRCQSLSKSYTAINGKIDTRTFVKFSEKCVMPWTQSGIVANLTILMQGQSGVVVWAFSSYVFNTTHGIR